MDGGESVNGEGRGTKKRDQSNAERPRTDSQRGARPTKVSDCVQPSTIGSLERSTPLQEGDNNGRKDKGRAEIGEDEAEARESASFSLQTSKRIMQKKERTYMLVKTRLAAVCPMA